MPTEGNITKVEIRYVPAEQIGKIFMKANLNDPAGFMPHEKMTLVDMPGVRHVHREANHPRNLETIYKHYQIYQNDVTERPVQLNVRSMTVGDCIVVNDVAYYVAPSGFVTRTPDGELCPVTVEPAGEKPEGAGCER